MNSTEDLAAENAALREENAALRDLFTAVEDADEAGKSASFIVGYISALGRTEPGNIRLLRAHAAALRKPLARETPPEGWQP